MKIIKIILPLLIISIFAIGCTAQKNRPVNPVQIQDIERPKEPVVENNAKDQKAVKEVPPKPIETKKDPVASETKTDTTKKDVPDTGLTKEDFEKLKNEINGLEFEDINGFSEK